MTKTLSWRVFFCDLRSPFKTGCWFDWSQTIIRAATRELQQGTASFSVGNPDVLDLHGVVEEPAAFALPCVEPVDRASFIRENLLQVSNRQRFRRCGPGFIGEAPNRIYVVVLRERLQKLVRAARDDIHHATRQVAGLTNLTQITGNERIFLRRNRNH